MNKGLTRSQLDDHTVQELRVVASEFNIPGRSTMNKDELIKAIATRMAERSQQKRDNADARVMPNHNTHTIVKNINGTSSAPYNRAVWLERYREVTRSTAIYCARLGCDRTARVGAHVQDKDGRSSNRWYIIPLCDSCNNTSNTSEMPIKNTIRFVPVTDI